MTMHLEGPWLSTTGKRKGKQKFRNAESAARAREQAESWAQIKAKYEPKTTNVTKTAQAKTLMSPPPFRRETAAIPSAPMAGGVCAAVEPMKYTGTKMMGIATMHKSNAVPVFSEEDAREISRMRRG